MGSTGPILPGLGRSGEDRGRPRPEEAVRGAVATWRGSLDFMCRKMLTHSLVLAGPMACDTLDKNDSDTDPGSASDHGHVKVMFRRADSEAGSPFPGTQEVELALTYSPCLSEFYVNNPNWASDGVKGAQVFADFADPTHPDYLCNQTDPERSSVDCEVGSITQDAASNRFLVRYRIHDADMEDKVLYAGPVPCPALTSCDGVLFAGSNSANGFGLGGAQAWVTTSFPQRDAVCGQGLPIELEIGTP